MLNLTEENFLIYAMKCYNAPHCILSEFESDIKRTKYLKRLFRRYRVTKILKERLILNHIIVLYNVFGAEATIRMLFLKCRGMEILLKPFLVFLNLLPDKIENIGIENKTIYTNTIDIDLTILKKLREI